MAESEKSAEWKRALFSARRLYEARHGVDLTYGEIGVRVAKLLRRESPVRKQQVASWFAGVVPNFQLGVALAQVLEVDPVELGLPLRRVDCGEEGGEADGQAAQRKPTPPPPLSFITEADMDRATFSVTGKAARRKRGATGD